MSKYVVNALALVLAFATAYQALACHRSCASPSCCIILPAQASPSAIAPPGKAPDGKGTPDGKGAPEALNHVPAPATLLVVLPADAQLTINGSLTKSTSDRRLFISPELDPGKDYFYTLTARIQRDGREATVTKDVAVRPGSQSVVKIAFAPTELAAK
jgi:uncharacterized protein (TIGR03000 family)